MYELQIHFTMNTLDTFAAFIRNPNVARQLLAGEAAAKGRQDAAIADLEKQRGEKYPGAPIVSEVRQGGGVQN